MTKREKLDKIAEKTDLFPHECVIGLFHGSLSNLVTLNELKDHIEMEIVEFNWYCDISNTPFLKRKEWTLKDYADKRKSTNLTRFDFCPKCGKRIDWAAIRKEDNDG